MYCLIALMCLFIFGFVYLGNYCPDRVCALTAGPILKNYNRPFSNQANYDDHRLSVFKDQANHLPQSPDDIVSGFHDSDLNRNYNFSIEGYDVIVFLQIQKTSSTTFGRHLVRNVDLNIPCQCYKHKGETCDCKNSKNNIWLFSRLSTGWLCGVHADWTELQNCVSTAVDKLEGLSRYRRYLHKLCLFLFQY